MRATDAKRGFPPLATFLMLGLAYLVIPGDYGKACAQESPSAAQGHTGPKQGGPTNVIHAGNEDYRLGAGDVIQVRIDRAPELSGNYSISRDGTLQMPYVGGLVAGGRTTEELSRVIADSLKDRYLKNPLVIVDVLQYNSRTFFIQGGVRSPGVYQIAGRPTLIQLINIAGGLAENHGATAFIIRERTGDAARTADSTDRVEGGARDSKTETDSSEPSKYELIKANIAGLFKGNFDQNIEIHPGDIVNIPPTDVFFVAGEVRLPGQYPLRSGTSLRQAISVAAGTTVKAAPGRGLIFREDPVTGRQRAIPVDIGAVLRAKKEDVLIMPNDVVVVPNSALKSAVNVLLTGLGGSAGSLMVNVARMPAQ